MNLDHDPMDWSARPASDGQASPPPVVQRAARVAVAVALLGLGVWTVSDFLPALAWAAVFVIATWPLYRRFGGHLPERRRGILAPLLFTLVIGLVFVAPLGLAAFEVAREAHIVVRWALQAQKHGLAVPEWVPHLPVIGDQASTWWTENLSDPDAAADLLGRFDRDTLVSWTRTFGRQLLHRATLFLFMLLTLFFLFRDGASVAERLRRLAERLLGHRGERLAGPMIGAVHGTVNGLVLVGLGEGILLGITYVAAGVPHPALFGALTGVLAMIPFGAPVMYGAASLLLLAKGSVAAAAVVFGIGSAVVFVADHFVRPVLIGGAVRLPFLWVLLGILGGLETFGLLGLFLGPAIMAVLISLWREWTDPLPPSEAAAKLEAQR